MRGIPNVSFILLDEADFFPPGQQQDARAGPGIADEGRLVEDLQMRRDLLTNLSIEGLF